MFTVDLNDCQWLQAMHVYSILNAFTVNKVVLHAGVVNRGASLVVEFGPL